jgi:DNA-binding transcriptional ArsR family regulator
MRLPTMKEDILALLAQGLPYAEIQRRTGASKPTISYHANRNRLGRSPDSAAGRRYDWTAIQQYYDEGHTVRECMERFGFATNSWVKAIERGRIVRRDHLIPLDDLLVVGRGTNRGHLKGRLLAAGRITNQCVECGISEWRGKTLVLHLDHINGQNNDDRLENLRLVCPNCHSQTDTYCGGNNGRAASARRQTRSNSHQ